MNPMRVSKAIPLTLFLLLFVAWGCGNEPPLEGDRATTPGKERNDNRDELCRRHDAPVNWCFICDPALREPGRLWCTEHDRYEDRCFLCHPELEDPERLWCAEHSLYEDECFLCHPELSSTASSNVATSNELECPEHGVLEKECGICHPELAADLELGAGLKIRFESSRSATLAGVRTARPIVAGDRVDATFLARVTWDQNHFARVTPLAGGVLQKVVADVGQSVSLGDRLATLSSPVFARSKSTYLSAQAEERLKLTVLEREQRLVEQKVSAQQELDQAHADYEIARNTTGMARQQLLNLGLTEEAIRLMEEKSSASSNLDILAPLSGTIVDRHAVPGEAVEPGDALFRIANLSSMWLELSIPESEVSMVSAGQEVVATFDAHPGLEATGRVTWVGSSVDEENRMVKGRAVVANPARQLRHGMFGRVRIRSETESSGLFVPTGAVQHIDEQAYVFARLAEDLYELRRVVLGGPAGDRVAITAGLDSNDEVVVSHSFILKSEFLKSRLGAGCVDE